MQVTAGIVVIGDEILSGKFQEENAAFLIGELRELGVNLARIAVIPDEIGDIAATVKSFSDRFDHVFTSGGVGPTHDDITMAGIAKAFDTVVVIDSSLEKLIRAYWGESMPKANLRLAEVPKGAKLIETPAAWPVITYRNIYILPGIPKLFRMKFRAIKERFRTTCKFERRLHLRTEEGPIAEALGEIASEYPGVDIGSYPQWKKSGTEVILTIEGHEETDVAAAYKQLQSVLADVLMASRDKA